MANNRMYLIHRPTGKTITIAKQYGIGWSVGHEPSLSERLEKFFQDLESQMHDGDSDFVLALESDINNQAPMCGLILGYSGDHVPSKFIDPIDRAVDDYIIARLATSTE
jgi:hypothetical protein